MLYIWIFHGVMVELPDSCGKYRSSICHQSKISHFGHCGMKWQWKIYKYYKIMEINVIKNQCGKLLGD